MKNITVDFASFEDPREVHTFLQRKLEREEYIGRNLDALYDVLTTIDEDVCIRLMLTGRRYEEGFKAVLKDSALENSHVFATFTYGESRIASVRKQSVE